ncbi:MAG: phosphopantetheine-binding protein [Bauldia sp.]|nr:phosphopantetheine-binding protein [Bauldia sp.]
MSEAITLESMRADIAAAIGIAPEEIGDHDNLADLGLDSIRAMMLVDRWSEAGITLTFAEMAEQVELAAWHAIVARKLAALAAGAGR